MRELAPFLIANDKNPPDIISEMFDEGMCRASVLQNPDSMTSQELEIFRQKQMKYYRENMIRILRQILQIKNIEIPVTKTDE
jgi:hypothetical protein